MAPIPLAAGLRRATGGTRVGLVHAVCIPITTGRCLPCGLEPRLRVNGAERMLEADVSTPPALIVETASGVEPPSLDLQSSALPLDHAVRVSPRPVHSATGAVRRRREA